MGSGLEEPKACSASAASSSKSSRPSSQVRREPRRKIELGVKPYAAYLRFIASMAYQKICHRVVSVATVLCTVSLPLSPALTRSSECRVPRVSGFASWRFEISTRFHCRFKPTNLADGVDQLPYSREMMIVVFRYKIQMVYKPHGRLQTRVRNSSRK